MPPAASIPGSSCSSLDAYHSACRWLATATSTTSLSAVSASEALKADREVVLAAVAQDGDALEHASPAYVEEQLQPLFHWASQGAELLDRHAFL
eukprot:COSAG04_NODE_21386_length_374_cov_1.087273_1_plen_93_part_01